MALPLGPLINDPNAKKTTAYDSLPVGSYDAIVEDAVIKQTKPDSKKYPNADYINWTFAVIGGEYDGRKAFYNNMLVPDSVGYLIATLVALGFTEEEVQAPDFDLDLAAVVGRKVTITMKKDKDQNGNPTTSVGKVLAAGSVAESPF